MVIKISTLFIAIVLISGCSFSKQETLYTGDITGDNLNDTIVAIKTDVIATDDVLAVYPNVFSELTVTSKASDGDKEILHINEEGLTVESGDKVSAGITTQAAYAAKLEVGPDNAFTSLTIVQINAEGAPVSEPLTLRWNVDTIGWVLQ